MKNFILIRMCFFQPIISKWRTCICLWENSNRLLIPEKILNYLLDTILFTMITTKNEINDYFSSKEKQYFQKQYGFLIPTYFFCQYLGHMYLQDETCEYSKIDLSNFFYCKKSIKYFITFCFTIKITHKPFIDSLYLLYNKLPKNKTKTKAKVNFALFPLFLLPLFATVVIQNNFAMCTIGDVKLSNLLLLELFPKIMKIKGR